MIDVSLTSDSPFDWWLDSFAWLTFQSTILSDSCMVYLTS